MHILIDKDHLMMIAAAKTRKWANLIAYVCYPEANLVVVDSLDGPTWSVLTREELATLYKNASGQEAPEYGQALADLRAYADTWPPFGQDEASLEAEAEKIYQQEVENRDPVQHAAMVDVQQRAAHQATIGMVEAANGKLMPAQKAQQPAPAARKPQAATSPADRPKQGITKRIWEIADELLAVTGAIGDAKEFRKTVMARAEQEGANPGTAATQFGKWKAAKGL